MNDLKVPCSGTGKQTELLNEFEEDLITIDDMVDIITKVILDIARSNDALICTECLRTANRFYLLSRMYAREENADRVYREFGNITGRLIDDL